MTGPASWANLHDAVITAVALQFPERRVTLGLDTPEGPMLVCGEEAALLICPQKYPWGRSHDVYVNQVRHERTLEGDRLEVETQNGDVIIIEAKRISLQVSPLTQATNTGTT